MGFLIDEFATIKDDNSPNALVHYQGRSPFLWWFTLPDKGVMISGLPFQLPTLAHAFLPFLNLFLQR